MSKGKPLIKIPKIHASQTLWIAAALVLLAGFSRYAQMPTFWIDEAFVAVSLRSPSPETIFAPLEYFQFFPRVYLAMIALVREALGYHIWVIRLVPFLCFITATVLWTRILSEKTRSFLPANLIAAALFIGSFFWIEQAINLKQYTFDVLLALIPFLIKDDVIEDGLLNGRRKMLLLLLAIPCGLSYTYPIALGSRFLGWYIFQRPKLRRINLLTVSAFASAIASSMVVIWLTDHRFNYRDIGFYYGFWDACILKSCINDGPVSVAGLLAKFFWGWHRNLGVIGIIEAPFQIIGLFSIVRQLRHKWRGSPSAVSDSRSVGSVFVIGSVMAASLFANYPMCAGRLTLFALIHIQILAIEGMIVVFLALRRRRPAMIALYVVIAAFSVLNGVVYYRFIRSEPAQNLRPIYKLIDPNISDTVWVHSCSVPQVRSLEEPLPAANILLGIDARPRDKKVWVLWTHLQEEQCKTDLNLMRKAALTWQIVSETDDRHLVLADY